MNEEDGGLTVGELADRLWRAETERVPMEPVTDLQPDLTVAEAYAVQAHNIRRRIDAGIRLAVGPRILYVWIVA